MTTFFQILACINDHFGNLLLLLVAIGSLIYAYREYSLKRRPIVVPAIQSEVKDGNWYFYLLPTNLGLTPAHIQIDTAILKIGDESYPTIFPNPMLIQGSGTTLIKQNIAPIGHINQLGRSKIIGHEFKENRCEIVITIRSKAIGDKKFTHQSNFIYQVDVRNEAPLLLLTKEEID